MRIALAVALVLAALPATAEARTFHLRPLHGVAASADGGRYVAVQRRFGGAVRIRDERTGKRFTLTGVPSGCTEPVVGGRWLMMGCPTVDPPDYPHPHVWNLAHPDRGAYEVPATLPQGAAPIFHYTGVGRRWVAVTIVENHYTTRGLVERASGHFIGDPADRRRAVEDLDARSGRHSLCAPLTRPRARYDYPETGPRYEEIAYEHPYAAELRDGRLVLRRCGTRHVKVLSRCSWSDCTEPVIAGGAVAWAENGRVRAYVIRTKRRRAWWAPHGDSRNVAIGLSRRHVIVNGRQGTLPGR